MLTKQNSSLRSSLRHTAVRLAVAQRRRNPAVARHARQGRNQHRHAEIQGRRTEQRYGGESVRLSRPDARRRSVRQRLPGRFGRVHLQGLEEAGIPNNTALIFSELMDAKSLFLTANADTIYFFVNLDVTKGPMVVETPPLALGVVDDMWFQWVTDFGLPGPDRGEGGKYLFVPPGYKGELPGSGYFVQKMRTTRATMLGRAFLEKNDPKPVVARIKKTLKVYPYLPGGYGTSIGSALEGKATLARTPDHKLDWAFLRPEEPVKFIEGTGKVMNTVPPNDFSYFELINDLVQKEPVGALDPEIMGSLAAIGIVKGKPFNPDARMKKILTDAAAIGTAAARTLTWRARPAEGGLTIPAPHGQHAVGRRLQLRNAAAGGQRDRRHHGQSAHRRPNAQLAHGDFLLRHLHHAGHDHAADRDRLAVHRRIRGLPRRVLRRLQDLQGDASAQHPGGEFWSFTVYDNQTRSMLDTPQRYPRAGSQSYPTPAAEANPDGSTTIYFAPTRPDGIKPGNWIQTDPKKGWNTLLRLYSPLEPFFTKAWRPSEIEMVSGCSNVRFWHKADIG